MTSNGVGPEEEVVDNFLLNVLELKFGPIGVRTRPVGPFWWNPKRGDGNPRSYIKGGNLTRGGHLHPRISATKSHVFASPMDPISMGEGSLEAMKERG
jgi:hypothetical protein